MNLDTAADELEWHTKLVMQFTRCVPGHWKTTAIVGAFRPERPNDGKPSGLQCLEDLRNVARAARQS